MEKITYTFTRIEKKYLINKKQYLKLIEALSSYMQLDEYGKTTICNLYYDTIDDILIKKSLEKPIFKEKLRIRSYGLPKKEDRVFIEIKKKYKGVVYKRRVSMLLNEAEAFLNSGISKKNNQTINEISYFFKKYNLIPRLILIYERCSYFFLNNNDLRLTIDENIRSRRNNLNLDNSIQGESLLKDTYLLELKVQSSFPLWLSKILSDLNILPTSFSKYGAVYLSELRKNNYKEQ